MATFAADRSQTAKSRRDLLARTALCGAMFGLLAAPALAAPPGIIFSGSTQQGGGTAPDISVGPASTSVALHASRTIVNWDSFNVAEGASVAFTFGARNWIVLNKINSFLPATIDGSVTGTVGGAPGGNIWFSSPGGVIFGAGSRIDAGGILATAANIDDSSFLDPSNRLFSFSGNTILGDGVLSIEQGAQINAHGGLIALVSLSTLSESGSQVTASDGGSVLYGAARSFQLRLTQNVPGDLDLVDFIIPASGDGSEAAVALDLQGQTTGNSVFLSVVNHATTATVVSLDGLITAQAATSDGGDIVLSGGGGIANRAPGAKLAGASNTDLYLGQMTASRDINIQNAGMVFGARWLGRPPKKPRAVDPANCETRNDCVVEEDPGNGNGNGNGNGCYNGYCNGSGSLLTNDDRFKASLGADPAADALLARAGDPSFVSNLGAGRDIRLVATADIQLGRGAAGRNISVQGPSLKINGLNAAGGLSLKSTAGNIGVAAIALGGDGSVMSAGAAQVDGLTLSGGASQRVTVQAAGNVGIGDGASAVSGAGVVDVNAGANATINAGNTKLGSVIAVGDVDLRGNHLEVASIQGQRILGRANSMTIGQATSATDIYIFSAAGDATVGTATAADDIYINATGGTASLKTAVITGAGFDAVSTAFTGNPDTFGNGRVVSVTSTADARLGLGVGSVTGATVVTIDAAQDAFVDLPGALPGSLSVRAGRDASLKAPTANFSLISAGRDLSLVATGGDFTSTSLLTATRNITVGASGALRLGDVRADAGSITLTGATVTAGALSAAQDLTLQASNGGVAITSYKAGRDLIVQGSTLNLGTALAPIGRDLSITTPGDFTSNSDISVVRNLTLAINGTASVNALTAGTAIKIVAGDVNLAGTVTAPTIQIEARNGALRVGGSAADGSGAGALWIDNAEFGRLRASSAVNFYAGSLAATARGDLTLLNLDVNPASTPQLNFFVGTGKTAFVNGRVAPTTAAGGIIRIGDAMNVAWKPTSILVTGSLGAATVSAANTYTDIHAFDDIKLVASQDILMGSQRFVGLIQSTAVGDIDVGMRKPLGVAPTAGEQNRVFISTAKLEVSADGKVVQQNTSAALGQAVGLFLTGKATPALLIDPPQVVELFGGYLDPSGKFVTSFSAGGGLDFKIVDAQGAPADKPAGATYRFNSCDVGTMTCSASALLATSGGEGAPPPNALAGAPVAATEGGFTSDDATGEDPAASAEDDDTGLAAEAAGNRPVLLGVPPIDTKEIVSDPVSAGAGNEELWRNKVKQ